MIRIRDKWIRIGNANRWPGRMSREAYCRAVLDVLAAEQKRHQQQHFANGVNSSTGINSNSSSGNNNSNSSSGINGSSGDNNSSNSNTGSTTGNSSTGINSNSSSGNNSSNSSSGINSSNSSSGCGSINNCGGSSDGPIMVRLLLAIDRRRLEDMEDTVQLLLKLREAAFLLLSENFREKKSGVLMPIRIRILTQVSQVLETGNLVFNFIHRRASFFYLFFRQRQRCHNFQFFNNILTYWKKVWC